MTDVLLDKNSSSEHYTPQERARLAAQTAGSHIDAFVDGLLGQDEAGKQIKYGEAEIPVGQGIYRVRRSYDKSYHSENTQLTYTPDEETGPTVQMTMHEMGGDSAPSFGFYARERDLNGKPQVIDQFYFTADIINPNMDQLHRAEQFAAQVMDPVMVNIDAA